MEIVHCYFSVKRRGNFFYVENAVEEENENFSFYQYKTKEALTESEATNIKNEIEYQYEKGSLTINLEDESTWEHLYSD